MLKEEDVLMSFFLFADLAGTRRIYVVAAIFPKKMGAPFSWSQRFESPGRWRSGLLFHPIDAGDVTGRLKGGEPHGTGVVESCAIPQGNRKVGSIGNIFQKNGKM